MNARVKRIIDEVRDLLPSERRLVVDELAALDFADLEEPMDVEQRDARWTAEVLARKASLVSGESRRYSREEARAELAARLLARR